MERVKKLTFRSYFIRALFLYRFRKSNEHLQSFLFLFQVKNSCSSLLLDGGNWKCFQKDNLKRFYVQAFELLVVPKYTLVWCVCWFLNGYPGGDKKHSILSLPRVSADSSWTNISSDLWHNILSVSERTFVFRFAWSSDSIRRMELMTSLIYLQRNHSQKIVL